MLIDDRIYRLIKLLLCTAKEENTEVTATKLQKIFFLLEKEKGIQLGLDFKPWFFGPYSSKLQDYIDKLIESGEVDVEEEEVRDPLSGVIIGYKRNYVLKSELKPEEEEKEIEMFFREWVRKSRTEILNYVYKKYPEYAKYSMIRDKVLSRLQE
ncbi:conjugal transfer protein [Saccharolobus islandicus]|uniref:Conserved lipothrixviral protein n=1 Tax=Saccharolobus islandicus (strain REY15A) TaxID=930945 RepID=F0NBL3_SACI5|nr:conjugal transfer protein [Sulfolobus islandicus]ADX85550.1 conserved lipothrixviral protein [Sulfolobus islandicus REY15A]